MTHGWLHLRSFPKQTRLSPWNHRLINNNLLNSLNRVGDYRRAVAVWIFVSHRSCRCYCPDLSDLVGLFLSGLTPFFLFILPGLKSRDLLGRLGHLLDANGVTSHRVCVLHVFMTHVSIHLFLDVSPLLSSTYEECHTVENRHFAAVALPEKISKVGVWVESTSSSTFSLMLSGIIHTPNRSRTTNTPLNFRPLYDDREKRVQQTQRRILKPLTPYAVRPLCVLTCSWRDAALSSIAAARVRASWSSHLPFASAAATCI